MYEQKLQAEIKQWTHLLRDAARCSSNPQRVPLELGIADLDERQLNYCQKAPDFQRFQFESNAFCLRAEQYLQKVTDLRKKLGYIERVAPLESQIVDYLLTNHLLPFPKD